jgi:hypothetical protein
VPFAYCLLPSACIYLITLFARASSSYGSVIPICFATLLAPLLPECLQEHRDARRSAITQETDAEDFSRLPRLSHGPTPREGDSEGDKPYQF